MIWRALVPAGRTGEIVPVGRNCGWRNGIARCALISPYRKVLQRLTPCASPAALETLSLNLVVRILRQSGAPGFHEDSCVPIRWRGTGRARGVVVEVSPAAVRHHPGPSNAGRRDAPAVFPSTIARELGAPSATSPRSGTGWRSTVNRGGLRRWDSTT